VSFKIHPSLRKSSTWHLLFTAAKALLNSLLSPAVKLAEDRALHEAKLAKMETEMKMVFQQKVAEKEAKLKQSEEELYARHREMKDALEKQRADLEDKKRRIESGRPLTPDKTVRANHPLYRANTNIQSQKKPSRFLGGR
jgi:septin family protein